MSATRGTNPYRLSCIPFPGLGIFNEMFVFFIIHNKNYRKISLQFCICISVCRTESSSIENGFSISVNFSMFFIYAQFKKVYSPDSKIDEEAKCDAKQSLASEMPFVSWMVRVKSRNFVL